ncbi:hypothetical protein ACROYT_G041971 [Oculina patagonica]
MAENRRHVFQFLETLAEGTKGSSTQARIRLARKLAERLRLVKQRKAIRRRMRELAKSLETKEAEIAIVEEEIQKLEQNVEDGTDHSSSEED